MVRSAFRGSRCWGSEAGSIGSLAENRAPVAPTLLGVRAPSIGAAGVHIGRSWGCRRSLRCPPACRLWLRSKRYSRSGRLSRRTMSSAHPSARVTPCKSRRKSAEQRRPLHPRHDGAGMRVRATPLRSSGLFPAPRPLLAAKSCTARGGSQPRAAPRRRTALRRGRRRCRARSPAMPGAARSPCCRAGSPAARGKTPAGVAGGARGADLARRPNGISFERRCSATTPPSHESHLAPKPDLVLPKAHQVMCCVSAPPPTAALLSTSAAASSRSTVEMACKANSCEVLNSHVHWSSSASCRTSTGGTRIFAIV